MTRPRVLVSQPVHEAGMALLASRCDVVVAPDAAVATLRAAIGEAEGLLARTAPISADVIDAAPRLKVIARHGVGVDNIDVAAATRRGIPVAYTPDANRVSVAEQVLALLLALAKRLHEYDAATRRGAWEVRNGYGALDLAGKRLGVVGMGRVGATVAQKAGAGLDMRVLGYDPNLPREIIAAAGAEPVARLEDLLAAADAVTLHVPLTPATRGLLGARALASMRPTAFLINTSRGGVVDEAALHAALSTGRLRGAALDVFEAEPPPADHPLLALPNVIVTPHSAALTAECAVRMATGAARAIIDALDGRRPADVVNPEVYWSQEGD
jgi:D-3-phosphoglycerate dehydrogenase